MSTTSPRIQRLTPERARALTADPARQRLLDQIMDAVTREEIDAAWLAQRSWLASNPDDIGVLEAGEDLAHAEEALSIVAGTTPGASSDTTERPIEFAPRSSLASEPASNVAQPRRAVILTALSLEYDAVRSHLSEVREEVHLQGTVYEVGRFASSEATWSIGIAEIGAGNEGAAAEAEHAIQHFHPEIAIFVGVAGGIKDVALGDVVAATKVYGYHAGKDADRFQPRPSVGESAYSLVQRARAEARRTDWLRHVNGHAPTEAPTVRVAPIAAGEQVVASNRSATFKFLRAQYSDAVAVEMEGRGFLRAVHANPGVQALVIRGISDLIEKKEESDAAGWQPIAARHASAFAFQILAKLGASPPRP